MLNNNNSSTQQLKEVEEEKNLNKVLENDLNILK